MKRRLTKLQKLLVLIAAVVAGFYFYLNQVYDPAMNEYERVNQELASLRAEVIGQDMVTGSRILQERIGRGRQEATALEERLRAPAVLRKARSDREVTEALAEVKRLALNSGLEVVKLEARSAPEETVAQPAESDGREEATGAMMAEGAGHFAWREYHLVCAGDLPRLIRFLEEKSKAEYLVLIENVKIDHGRDAGGEGNKPAVSGISEMPKMAMELLI